MVEEGKENEENLQREEFTVAVLPLVRVWVGGDDGVQAGG